MYIDSFPISLTEATQVDDFNMIETPIEIRKSTYEMSSIRAKQSVNMNISGIKNLHPIPFT
jgi:hypothetical protein